MLQRLHQMIDLLITGWSKSSNIWLKDDPCHLHDRVDGRSLLDCSDEVERINYDWLTNCSCMLNTVSLGP